MKFLVKPLCYLTFLFASFSSAFADPSLKPNNVLQKGTDDLPPIIEREPMTPKWFEPSDHHLSFVGGKKFLSLYDNHITINELQISYFHHFTKNIPWIYWDLSLILQANSRFHKVYSYPLYGNIDVHVNDMTGGGLAPKLMIKPTFYGFSPFISAGYRATYSAGTIEINSVFATTQAALYQAINGKELAIISQGVDLEAGLAYSVSKNVELIVLGQRSTQQIRYPDVAVNELNQVYLKDSGWQPKTFDALMLGFAVSLEY